MGQLELRVLGPLTEVATDETIDGATLMRRISLPSAELRRLGLEPASLCAVLQVLNLLDRGGARRQFGALLLRGGGLHMNRAEPSNAQQMSKAAGNPGNLMITVSVSGRCGAGA
jgi:hypothetical protein